MFFICCTTLIGVISCKKSNTNPLSVTLYNKPLDSIKYYIQGKWKLVKQVGGIGGSTAYPQNIYWEFANNDIFILTDNGISETDTCTWKKVIINGTDSIYTVTLKKGIIDLMQTFINEISNDTLKFYDPCCDGYDYFLTH